jgi:hypothetical protein
MSPFFDSMAVKSPVPQATSKAASPGRTCAIFAVARRQA